MDQNFLRFLFICIVLGQCGFGLSDYEQGMRMLMVKDRRLLVGMTLVEDAAAKGAVCLDGSLPGYHLHRGSGSGARNWLLQFEGGAWCNNITSCLKRSKTALGSTHYMNKYEPFSGILSDNSSLNPDFYSWNRVKIRYCDGASFAGDSEFHNATTSLFFRGQSIWEAVIQDLLPKGLNLAEKALLSGCSAGGLATFLHCDDFAQSLPRTAIVKCLSDAGFFPDLPDISGVGRLRRFFNSTVSLQGVEKNLNKDCINSRNYPYQCFFPQYAVTNIQTPFFILNSAYDVYQFLYIFVSPFADPHGIWNRCKENLAACTPNQISILQGYRNQLLTALKPLKNSTDGGMFINSCFAHCQSETQDTWFASDSPRLHNKKIAEVVGDWYFERKAAKEVGCPYPCDDTCHNIIPTGVRRYKKLLP